MKSSLKPFIKELLVSVLIFAVIVLSVIYVLFTNTLKINTATILFIISLAVFLLLCFKNIKVGVLALADFIFGKTEEVKGTLKNQIPYEAGWFTDKYTEFGSRSVRSDIRYSVVIKVNSQYISLISPTYIDAEAGDYTLLIGKYSGIILNKCEK